MPAPTGRHLFYLFALLVLALLINAGMVWQQTLRLIEANEESRRLASITTLLHETLESVLNAETGQRGYIITGDEKYLQPYHRARDAIEGHLDELEQLAAERPELAAAIDEVEQLIAAKFDELQGSVRIREQQGLAEAARLVQSGRGRQLMDRLRRQIRSIESGKEESLRQVADEVDRVATTTLYANIFASLLGVLLVLAVAWMSWRDTRQRESSARQLEDINRRMASTVGEMERRNQEMQQLSRLSNYLQTSESPEEIFGILTATLQQLFPEDSGGMFELNPSHDYLELRASWGDSCPINEEVIAPQDCWALRWGRPYRVGEDAPGPLCIHVRDPGVTEGENIAYSCLPIVAQSEIIGLLHIRWHGKVPDLSTARHRLRLAETTAEQIGLSLSNLRLRRSLQEQSIKDPLSGLYNRRHFEESLNRELALAERKQTLLVLALMDIDHFKPYNDTHGHQAGDRVIERLGRCLRTQVRGSDIACRWGGEEFILLLPETDAESGHARLDELRQTVAELKFGDGDRSLPGITISIGMACRPEHGSEAETLIKTADRALYQAKREGRDRVAVASAPEEQDDATDNNA